MENELSDSLPVRSFFLAIIFLVWESFLAYWLLTGIISWPLFFLGHFLLLCFGFVLLYFTYFLSLDARFLSLLLLFTSIMGLFGAAIGCLIIILHAFFLLIVDPISDLIKDIMPKIFLNKAKLIHDRITFGLDSFDTERDPEPLIDVMMYGSVSQKIRAINNLLKYYRPEFVPALKIAVNDKSSSVRILAATAISHLEERFHDQYMVLQNDQVQNPTDLKANIHLAEHCYEYVKSIFFDESRTIKMRKKAIEAYNNYLKLKPDDHQALLTYTSLLIDQDEIDLAEKNLLLLEQNEECISSEQFLLRMKLLFRQKKYEEMRKYTNKYFEMFANLPEQMQSSDIDEMFFTWSQRTSAL